MTSWSCATTSAGRPKRRPPCSTLRPRPPIGDASPTCASNSTLPRTTTTPSAQAALRSELDMIVEQLRAAVGLGGRDRTMAGNAERARVAVRKAITAALDRLAEHDSTFAQHLRLHIRTGTCCRCEPDPTNPVDWNV